MTSRLSTGLLCFFLCLVLSLPICAAEPLSVPHGRQHQEPVLFTSEADFAATALYWQRHPQSANRMHAFSDLPYYYHLSSKANGRYALQQINVSYSRLALTYLSPEEGSYPILISLTHNNQAHLYSPMLKDARLSLMGYHYSEQYRALIRKLDDRLLIIQTAPAAPLSYLLEAALYVQRAALALEAAGGTVQNLSWNVYPILSYPSINKLIKEFSWLHSGKTKDSVDFQMLKIPRLFIPRYTPSSLRLECIYVSEQYIVYSYIPKKNAVSTTALYLYIYLDPNLTQEEVTAGHLTTPIYLEKPYLIYQQRLASLSEFSDPSSCSLTDVQVHPEKYAQTALVWQQDGYWLKLQRSLDLQSVLSDKALLSIAKSVRSYALPTSLTYLRQKPFIPLYILLAAGPGILLLKRFAGRKKTSCSAPRKRRHIS